MLRIKKQLKILQWTVLDQARLTACDRPVWYFKTREQPHSYAFCMQNWKRFKIDKQLQVNTRWTTINKRAKLDTENKWYKEKFRVRFNNHSQFLAIRPVYYYDDVYLWPPLRTSGRCLVARKNFDRNSLAFLSSPVYKAESRFEHLR